LEVALKSGDAMKALKEYQSNAGKSSEQLAKEQLSVTEKQAIAVSQIRDSILLGLDKSKRETITKKYGDAMSSGATIVQKTNDDLGDRVIATAEGSLGLLDKMAESIEKVTGTGRHNNPVEQDKYMKIKNAGSGNAGITEIDPLIRPVNDLFLSEGSAPQLFSKGTLYKGIVGDEVAIGTGLSDAFNKTGKLTELMASIPSRNNGSGENTSVNGKIDININLGGSVSGDNGNVEKMFSDPKFQKQMMDMVLYKMDKYKQQQGTLS